MKRSRKITLSIGTVVLFSTGLLLQNNSQAFRAPSCKTNWDEVCDQGCYIDEEGNEVCTDVFGEKNETEQ